MNTEQIKQKLQSKEYDFLRENEHLGNNIILLTTGGSHAYGTNVETSDLDIRGVAIEREKEILGLSNFEQVDNKTTDTTIYSFRKIINLLLNCNPNVIEMLGTKDEHLFILSEEGKLLRDNVDLFLSKKALNSFGGYATAQLRRLQNALARDNYPQAEKEQHILNSIMVQMNHLQKHYKEFTNEDINLYIDKTDREDYEKEIFMDIQLNHYPLRDFKNIYSEMSNVVKDYGKLNHRNKKKSDEGLNKHAMHLVRLLLMGTEILEGKGINTYRGKDREQLLEIRNGKYQKEDGSFNKEFFDMINDLEKKLKYAADNSPLPNKPNFNKIEELVVEINKKRLIK
jgi:predicted nucleotidyltransferase